MRPDEGSSVSALACCGGGGGGMAAAYIPPSRVTLSFFRLANRSTMS